jgi:hypothetical protein
MCFINLSTLEWVKIIRFLKIKNNNGFHFKNYLFRLLIINNINKITFLTNRKP